MRLAEDTPPPPPPRPAAPPWPLDSPPPCRSVATNELIKNGAVAAARLKVRQPDCDRCRGAGRMLSEGKAPHAVHLPEQGGAFYFYKRGCKTGIDHIHHDTISFPARGVVESGRIKHSEEEEEDEEEEFNQDASGIVSAAARSLIGFGRSCSEPNGGTEGQSEGVHAELCFITSNVASKHRHPSPSETIPRYDAGGKFRQQETDEWTGRRLGNERKAVYRESDNTPRGECGWLDGRRGRGLKVTVKFPHHLAETNKGERGRGTCFIRAFEKMPHDDWKALIIKKCPAEASGDRPLPMITNESFPIAVRKRSSTAPQDEASSTPGAMRLAPHVIFQICTRLVCLLPLSVDPRGPPVRGGFVRSTTESKPVPIGYTVSPPRPSRPCPVFWLDNICCVSVRLGPPTTPYHNIWDDYSLVKLNTHKLDTFREHGTRSVAPPFQTPSPPPFLTAAVAFGRGGVRPLQVSGPPLVIRCQRLGRSASDEDKSGHRANMADRLAAGAAMSHTPTLLQRTTTHGEQRSQGLRLGDDRRHTRRGCGREDEWL
ncbi:hypothetical protein EYF80_010943 [Liparis tanakae]|uniref:Uncharacterized protein n=1 Tax=Liparis tanakae TaxID=230148 RepID=A0A4Z2INM8_9TELE|nr:hypothetical protein EYF80_010943 [Liparis tanakae]